MRKKEFYDIYINNTNSYKKQKANKQNLKIGGIVLKEKQSLPSAPILIESIRSIGYSFQSAIADLIDNSISAKAKRIDIYSMPSDDPYIVIFDNGKGMNKLELEEAMRLGSKNPNEERDENDLGRFGLGLKSASLSQCRKLIVVSKNENKLSAFSWDLDYVVLKNSWTVLEYEKEDIEKLPYIELFNNVKNGTYILLKDFDRIEAGTSNLSKTISEKINLTIDHLSLVFHRYIDEGLEIYVNDRKIEALDPFLTKNRSTQVKRTQTIKINNETITVKPYILPHFNKLSEEDLKKVGGKEDLKKNQGFYIYRNKRLIIWGTWFRLSRQEELGKLARIMVEIPNSLDKVWGIDVKKSTANIPDIIKKNLYSCVEESIFTSKEVYKYRGRKENKGSKNLNYIWDRIKTREGFEYKINRELPQLQLFSKDLSKEKIQDLEKILKYIEMNFPINTIYLDVADGKIKENKEIKEEDVEEIINDFKRCIQKCKENGLDIKNIYNQLINTEPYCNSEEIRNKMKKEIEKYE